VTDAKLLAIVEDDETFARTLRRSFERRGYEVMQAASHEELVEQLADRTPRYAVVDLKLGGASGLVCVQTLHAHDPEILVVVLTGFASIATAVEAIKLGASHYLVDTELSERPTSIKTLEWERIHTTLAETDFNISETARRLGMHRRTLARKLEKRPVK